MSLKTPLMVVVGKLQNKSHVPIVLFYIYFHIAWFLTYRRVGLVKMGKIIIFKVNNRYRTKNKRKRKKTNTPWHCYQQSSPPQTVKILSYYQRNNVSRWYIIQRFKWTDNNNSKKFGKFRERVKNVSLYLTQIKNIDKISSLQNNIK